MNRAARGDDEDPLMHQIGSVRYAGEQYVRAFAEHGQLNVWKVRDAISSGQSWERYGGNPEAAKILDRFVAFAFEYLRTMLLAFRQEQKDASVNLVLVGNGWHLADAFSQARQQQSARAVFERSYKHVVTQLGVPGIQLHFEKEEEEESPLSKLPSSKHLVVIGALQNSWNGNGRRELNLEETELPKLPAGRGMQLGTDESGKRFQWHDLVGDGIPLEPYSLGDLRADSVFYLEEIPPVVETWRKHLLEQFRTKTIQGIPYPTQAQIRSQILSSIQSPPPRVGKGPLQIIIEQSWVNKLTP